MRRDIDIADVDGLTVRQAVGLADLDDVQAALACICSCHTRRFGFPADTDLHDGGADCSCQYSREERRARMQDWFAQRQEFWDSEEGQQLQARQAAARERATRRAGELGLDDFRIVTEFVPLQLEATWHGLSVYLRSRSGCWRLELGGQVIAEGTDPEPADLVSWVELLWDRLDRHVRAEDCEHPAGTPFCGLCGQRLTQ